MSPTIEFFSINFLYVYFSEQNILLTNFSRLQYCCRVKASSSTRFKNQIWTVERIDAKTVVLRRGVHT
jgi:hypothetical protein